MKVCQWLHMSNMTMHKVFNLVYSNVVESKRSCDNVKIGEGDTERVHKHRLTG